MRTICPGEGCREHPKKQKRRCGNSSVAAAFLLPDTEKALKSRAFGQKEKVGNFYQNYLPFVAEKEGFEPSIPLWGIHDFQSCALDQATRLLHVLFGLLSFQIVSLHIIIKICHKVKSHFERNAFLCGICFSSADRRADFARFGRGSGPAAPWRPAFGAAGTARCSPPRRAAPPA